MHVLPILGLQQILPQAVNVLGVKNISKNAEGLPTLVRTGAEAHEFLFGDLLLVITDACSDFVKLLKVMNLPGAHNSSMVRPD